MMHGENLKLIYFGKNELSDNIEKRAKALLENLEDKITKSIFFITKHALCDLFFRKLSVYSIINYSLTLTSVPSLALTSTSTIPL